ncbi:MAG: helical backbone metal receptor [Bacteroidota bacterium]
MTDRGFNQLMVYIDQLGRKIELPSSPKRIISLVPSQTELLYYLGLRDEVVGITKFCIHPEEWFRSKTRVGGTKKLNFETIRELQPDLIIGNKEENEKDQIEHLMQNYPVWMSDIYTLNDALDMINRIGALAHTQQQALFLKLNLEASFRQLEGLNQNNPVKTAAYFIWKNPMMVAGQNTFINDMLSKCGLKNVFDSDARYPEITPQLLAEKRPELILLSSEPYPFKEKDVQEFQAICPWAKIMVVDGELFSWYGSRLLEAPPYFEKLFTK